MHLLLPGSPMIPTATPRERIVPFPSLWATLSTGTTSNITTKAPIMTTAHLSLPHPNRTSRIPPSSRSTKYPVSLSINSFSGNPLRLWTPRAGSWTRIPSPGALLRERTRDGMGVRCPGSTRKLTLSGFQLFDRKAFPFK
jgi:hypothetical protein